MSYRSAIYYAVEKPSEMSSKAQPATSRDPLNVISSSDWWCANTALFHAGLIHPSVGNHCSWKPLSSCGHLSSESNERNGFILRYAFCFFLHIIFIDCFRWKQRRDFSKFTRCRNLPYLSNHKNRFIQILTKREGKVFNPNVQKYNHSKDKQHPILALRGVTCVGYTILQSMRYCKHYNGIACSSAAILKWWNPGVPWKCHWSVQELNKKCSAKIFLLCT